MTDAQPAAGFASPLGFDVLEEVGKGGMGVVFRARDTALDRDVAIKFLRTTFPPDSPQAERFLSEARVTAQLQHPGIPAVYQVGRLPDGRPWLAMKLIRGQTLSALWAARGRAGADVSHWLPVFASICQAVGAAHATGFIHRDLKPLNVMVGAFGEVQVMDWGLAKRVGNRERGGRVVTDPPAAAPAPDQPIDPNQTCLADTGGDPDETGLVATPGAESTRAGTIMGTPQYMAPEQARGDVDRLDARSDVFALGCVLCELLTGQPPLPHDQAVVGYGGNRYADGLARLDRCGADAEVAALCKRCLAFEPAHRPADASAVATAVAEYLAQFAERTKQAEVQIHRSEVKAQEERKRRRALYWSAGAALALLFAGVVGTTVGLFRANAAAEAERQASRLAQEKRAEADEAKEKAERERQNAEREQQNALKRLKQIEKGVESFAAMITDLEPTRERAGGDPVHVQLRKKAEKLAAELDGDAVGDPLVVARLQTLLGRSIEQLGNPQAALPVLKKAYATRVRELGAKHNDTLETAMTLAAALNNSGTYAEALELYERVRDHQAATFGRDHRVTLVTLNNLGNVYSALGRHLEAIKLYDESRAGELKLQGGVESEGTLISLGNMASAYENAGKRADAIRLYEQALPIWARLRGPNYIHTASVQHQLGRAYWHAGRFREAVELLEQARDVYERVRGAAADPHLDVLFWLGRAYWDNGKLPLSIQTFELLRELQTKKFGADSPKTLLSLDYLAYACRAAGRWSEAQSYSDQIMKCLVANPAAMLLAKLERGNSHPYTKDGVRSFLGRNHLSFEQAGQLDKAENWQRQWIDIIRANFKETDTLDFAEELTDLGRILRKQKKWADAEAVSRECLTIQKKKAPDAWTTSLTELQVGEALLGQKKYSAAEPLLLAGREGLLAKVKQIPSDDRYHVNDSTNLILQLYEEKGDRNQSAKWQKELEKDIAARSNNPDHKAALWVLSEGGWVTTTGGPHRADKVAGLPKTAFRLTHVGLDGRSVGDSGLEKLGECTEITELGLDKTPVTDAGLAHLKDLTRLRVLSARDTKITGTGLAHLAGAKEMSWLVLNNTPFADEGLRYVGGFKKLTHLNLYATKVTDAGLAHLKGSNELVDLTLGATAVTDAGLKHLAGLKALRTLWLHQNAVTDAGLECLSECPSLESLTLLSLPITDKGVIRLRAVKKLTRLNIGWTRVTDAGLVSLPLALTFLGLDNNAITDEGLAHLKRMKNLKELVLTRTKVTPKGVKDFHAALPGCKIVYSDSDGKDVTLNAALEAKGK